MAVHTWTSPAPARSLMTAAAAGLPTRRRTVITVVRGRKSNHDPSPRSRRDAWRAHQRERAETGQAVTNRLSRKTSPRTPLRGAALVVASPTDVFPRPLSAGRLIGNARHALERLAGVIPPPRRGPVDGLRRCVTSTVPAAPSCPFAARPPPPDADASLQATVDRWASIAGSPPAVGEAYRDVQVDRLRRWWVSIQLRDGRRRPPPTHAWAVAGPSTAQHAGPPQVDGARVSAGPDSVL